MCGRYANASSTADLLADFDAVDAEGEELPPSWNIAPTDPVRIVVERPDRTTGAVRRTVQTARWGLVPSWAKDRKGAARLINARSETVVEKPAFRKAAATRRCLVPALGYYEWQKSWQGQEGAGASTGAATTPWFLHDPDGHQLALAGLYEWWRDPAVAEDDPARWLLTCTIITREATDLLGAIHDRTPVLVPRAQRASWLDCTEADPATAERLLAALPEPRLAPYVVGPAVGNVRNDGPDLVRPAAAPPAHEPPSQLWSPRATN
jgi:putative SOS response-associated peptidase YedK